MGTWIEGRLRRVGVLSLVLGVWGVLPAAGQLNLGAETFVQAGGADITVTGYSVPSFVAWNDDALKDLVVGEGAGGITSRIRVYLNTGTPIAPQFSGFFYAQSNGADLVCTGLGCLGCFPRVVYWDADTRKDLLIGQGDGTIRLYLNTGSEAVPTFDGGAFLQVGSPGSKKNINVEARATPCVVDWNNDGRKDLVTGAYDSKIHLFLNEGTDAQPDFVSETFAQANGAALVVPGYRSSPVVIDLDHDGKKDLLVGNTDGQLFFYHNTGTDAAPTFSGYEYVKANGVVIDLASTPRSRPFACDWTGDGLLDVLIGAGDSKVHLYQGVPHYACADFNHSGRVDEDDLTHLVACALGESIVQADPACLDADLDEDGNVDQSDFGLLQRCLSADAEPMDPACASCGS